MDATIFLIVFIALCLNAVYSIYKWIRNKRNIQKSNKKINELDAKIRILESRLANKESTLRLLKAAAKAETENECAHLLQSTKNTIISLESRTSDLEKEIDEKRSQIIVLDEILLYQDFALYEPKYDFAESSKYKDELTSIRRAQKDLIKNNTAVTGVTNWKVNNSLSEGKKMVKDTSKLLLRAFNNECDMTINKVTYSNFAQSKKRIQQSYDAITKLGRIMSIKISPEYLNLKFNELHLAFEYQQKKQEEKERIRELKAEERELAKLRKEIEEERKKIKKEQAHYSTVIETVKHQILTTASEDEKKALQRKLSDLEKQLSEVNKNLEDVDYREANQKAGYVYIISNIGSFGENIYKIGMTRRLEPMERVYELGDASVPFQFDVHALIFSDDAPKLEAALHQAFEDKKVNMVNGRREFFNVSLEEIESVVKANYDETVEFIQHPEATQYRETLKLKERVE